MKVQLVCGDPERTERVAGVLSRSHDLELSEDSRRLEGTDVVVLVWPSDVQGREGAARLARPLDPLSSLAVLPVELTADRLGVAEVGVRYVVDPYHPMEVEQCVEQLVVGRAARGRVSWVGDTMVDEGARTVTRAGRPLDLTRKEFDLLAHLVRHRGQVQERSSLLLAVWSSTDYHPNVIEVTISTLRHKLEAHGPRILHTVRGIGYVCRPAGPGLSGAVPEVVMGGGAAGTGRRMTELDPSEDRPDEERAAGPRPDSTRRRDLPPASGTRGDDDEIPGDVDRVAPYEDAPAEGRLAPEADNPPPER
ncbi:winged helix family transcriptional regulator [Dermatobacter hominis]|uniref:winged helix family transcriptional regulator n=1 Tax=Dermatobacter hominis TaxID=2884263 RepID=UPI001D1127D6|nr:winged-helix domain-containing protein [Dermatobacter hominis]UDY37505.1 winged-helix domain-containing protein [Dermatobacter hominis]